MAQQLDIPEVLDGGELLAERTAERFRTEIRTHLGFREATVSDADTLLDWVKDHSGTTAFGDLDLLIEVLERRCRELAIEPPVPDRVERIARAAQRAIVDWFHSSIYERLSHTTRERLDELLLPKKGGV